MGKGYCMHGCYPVDKRWHSGGFRVKKGDIEKKTAANSPSHLKEELGSKVYSGGDFVVNDIFTFRRYVEAFGAEAGEELLQAVKPAGEPYVRGAVEDDKEVISSKIKKRGVSLSTIGQGPEMNAYLDTVDNLSTHYKFNPVNKVVDVFWATPESQVHQELVQRRQQAEQQINRTLGNLSDLYQQKQLLEHDLRQLEARLTHVEEGEKAESEGYEGYEDELKADFVDLVDQHTGRHSILQMQANNVFPSITADFYSMTGLDDLQSGHLKNLPENEKAVLRKKWKLYQQWKQQFQTAVRSRYRDVKQRLNSVMTSIEQTEEWLKPYVQDIKQISDDFDKQLAASHALNKYLPTGNANVYRQMKVIGVKDQSPGQRSDTYYDVVVLHGTQGALPASENPQAAGQGLAIFFITFNEYLCCKHVYDAVFKAQIDNKKNEVNEYIQKYLGYDGPIVSEEELEARREEILDEYCPKGEKKEQVENAATMEELDRIEAMLDWKHNRQGWLDRQRNNLLKFFGQTDEFYHPQPKDLRRQLVGPGFPTQFYLDYKYRNNMFVMK